MHKNVEILVLQRDTDGWELVSDDQYDHQYFCAICETYDKRLKLDWDRKKEPSKSASFP